MRLLHQLRDLRERLRQSPVLLKALFGAGLVALTALHPRALAWTTKEKKSTMAGDCVYISDLSEKGSFGAYQNSTSFKEPIRFVEDPVRALQSDAHLKEGRQVLANLTKTALSSHSPQRVIHPARKPLLHGTTKVEAKQSQPTGMTLVEEEQGADRDLARAQNQSDLSPPEWDPGPGRTKAKRGSSFIFVGLLPEFHFLFYFLLIASIGRSIRVVSGYGGAPTTLGVESKMGADPATAVEDPSKIGTQTEEDISDESSGSEVVAKKPEGDKQQGRDYPIWVTFEPSLGPWTKVKEGDQMIATHAFKRWGIERFEVGVVTKIEKTKVRNRIEIIDKLTIGFPADRTILKLKELSSLPASEDRDPEPFLSVPFVLLDRGLNRKINTLGPRLPDRVKTLNREGVWSSNLLNPLPEEP